MEVGAHARTSSVQPARHTVGVSIPYRVIMWVCCARSLALCAWAVCAGGPRAGAVRRCARGAGGTRAVSGWF